MCIVSWRGPSILFNPVSQSAMMGREDSHTVLQADDVVDEAGFEEGIWAPEGLVPALPTVVALRDSLRLSVPEEDLWEAEVMAPVPPSWSLSAVVLVLMSLKRTYGKQKHWLLRFPSRSLSTTNRVSANMMSRWVCS